MNIELTKRAKERGLTKIELLECEELDDCIAGVVYEKRIKNGERIEWVDPILIFKTQMKQGKYDQIVRFAEKMGVPLIFPEAKNFKSDYYGISFGGHYSLVKSWGYTSNHLPPSKRWNINKIKDTAKDWLPDTIVMAKIVQFISHKIDEELTEEDMEKEFCEQFPEFVSEDSLTPQ